MPRHDLGTDLGAALHGRFPAVEPPSSRGESAAMLKEELEAVLLGFLIIGGAWLLLLRLLAVLSRISACSSRGAVSCSPEALRWPSGWGLGGLGRGSGTSWRWGRGDPAHDPERGGRGLDRAWLSHGGFGACFGAGRRGGEQSPEHTSADEAAELALGTAADDAQLRQYIRDRECKKDIREAPRSARDLAWEKSSRVELY
ncbi:hypothetical protein T492DRAFT_1022203 [Pavlovales sp. CCMP2436]|nr:hypothetical protein T492DRAFT_1022203 [Pavlovales sp. CCMP2436]